MDLVVPVCWRSGGEANKKSRYPIICFLFVYFVAPRLISQPTKIGALRSRGCAELQLWISWQWASATTLLPCEHLKGEAETVSEGCQSVASQSP